MKQQDRQTAIWLFCFILLMGLFYWLDHNSWYQTVFLESVARLNTHVVAWIFSLLGLDLKQAGATIILPAGTIEIAKSCTGSFVFMIFAAAVIPFPAPWKYRLIGLFLGLAILLAVNLFRIFIIVLVVSRFPDSLWALHVIVGQLIVITGMLLFFLWWVKRSQSSIFFSFTRDNRLILKTLLLFIIAYLCAYWLYGVFLESCAGLFVKQQIDLHASWLITLINETIFSSAGFQYTAPRVELIEGCLSSPMVVFFAAIIFAWPAAWWKKLLIILLGFIPFFYLYHLLRAVLIAATLGIQTKNANLVYNLYGQIMLSLALMALIGFIWKSKRGEKISYRKLLGNFFRGAAAGILLGFAAGFAARQIIVPFVTQSINHLNGLTYNPQQTISLMPDLQLFVWVTLMWLTPGWSLSKKLFNSCLGAIGVLFIFSAFITTIEIFRLTPHVGLIKLGVILLPFLIYSLLFLRVNEKV